MPWLGARLGGRGAAVGPGLGRRSARAPAAPRSLELVCPSPERADAAARCYCADSPLEALGLCNFQQNSPVVRVTLLLLSRDQSRAENGSGRRAPGSGEGQSPKAIPEAPRLHRAVLPPKPGFHRNANRPKAAFLPAGEEGCRSGGWGGLSSPTGSRRIWGVG